MAIKGEKVGPYTLERRLGKGLEGEVWKGKDAAGGGAAVKLFLDPGAAAVFREAGPPHTPEHANVCRVLGANPAANPPHLMTDFVEGPTLREIMAAQKGVPLSALIPTLLQISRGLAALHKDKRAHLDLRPENVLLDGLGAVRLEGVLTEKAFLHRLSRTVDKKNPAAYPADVIASHLPYLAPELRKLPTATPVDGPRADMYAFGVLTYEAVTGALPVDGFDLKLPSQKDKRVPKIIDEVVMRALERNPRARTPNALALEAALMDGLDKANFGVFPVGEPAKWVRSTPWRPAGAVVGEETGKFVSIFKRLADEKQ